MGAVYSAINIVVEAMTEPESSEVYSDLDKSAQESENGSRKKSLSDYNTDTSASVFSVKLFFLKMKIFKLQKYIFYFKSPTLEIKN